jgi:twitching motility protein PilT
LYFLSTSSYESEPKLDKTIMKSNPCQIHVKSTSQSTSYQLTKNSDSDINNWSVILRHGQFYKSQEVTVKIFQTAIRNAINESMSDIYIAGGHPMVTRKGGTIQLHPSIQWSYREVDELVKQLLTPKQLELLSERKSYDHAMSLSNARLRINFFGTIQGLSLAIHILPGRIPTIEMLNLHPSLHDIASLDAGLILTCGATGDGKTSTNAAIIDDINRTRSAHVITLENPVEYRFKSDKAFIQQRELGSSMSSFAQGLIDVLREDPDVIVVGELRDPETMRLTLNAAESGHLVIATLHASSPEEAVHRLCNAVSSEGQNEFRYQIASTLNWLIVQKLIYLDKIKHRIPLLTIVRGNQAVKSLIRENKLNQMASAIQTGKNDGMFTEERYMNEFLKLKTNFEQPEEIFRPSLEASEKIYQSPLLDAGAETALPGEQTTGAHEAPIFVRTENAAHDAESILQAGEEGVSIQDLIKQLEVKD